jgi:hypothetical protein
LAIMLMWLGLYSGRELTFAWNKLGYLDPPLSSSFVCCRSSRAT